MEIVNVEAHTFEAMMEGFEQFTRRVDALCKQYGDSKKKQWLDSQEACSLLGVSKRTLQSLRETGRLRYTRIERKIFYRPQDIQALITNSVVGKEVGDGTPC